MELEEDDLDRENSKEVHKKTTCQQNQTSKEPTLAEKKKLLFVLTLNLLKFQRAIIMSRRRSNQRIRRRHVMLRCYYMRQLLEIQNCFLQFIPLLQKKYEQYSEVQTPPVSHESETATEDDDTPRFYEHTVSRFTADQWLTTFRMSQATFGWLCSQLRDALKPNACSVPLKNLIPLEKRVALALYAFSTGGDYREVADLFDVSRTSVCKFMKRFADAVIERLGNKLLAMPTSLKEYDEIRQTFHKASDMPPLVVGVLGQCEIPVNPVAGDLASYINESGNPTLNMHALIDDKLLFRMVFMGSRPQTFLIEEEIAKIPPQTISNRQLPCFVIAPSSHYPLRTWLMCRYTNPLDPHEHDFNDSVDQILEFKNKAFLRLFGRWKILQRKCDLEPKTMEAIALACCILHNLLEENEDGFTEEWNKSTDIFKLLQGKSMPTSNTYRVTRAAIEMRDYLARSISSTEM